MHLAKLNNTTANRWQLYGTGLVSDSVVSLKVAVLYDVLNCSFMPRRGDVGVHHSILSQEGKHHKYVAVVLVNQRARSGVSFPKRLLGSNVVQLMVITV